MGRSAPTSFIILDTQSAKNAETAENKGYDGGKKFSEINRQLAVNINGLPQAVHITTTNVSERGRTSVLLAPNNDQFELVQCVIANGGYTGESFVDIVQNTIGAEVVIAKQSDLRRLWCTCKRQL